jgi:hypothetical protein
MVTVTSWLGKKTESNVIRRQFKKAEGTDAELEYDDDGEYGPDGVGRDVSGLAEEHEERGERERRGFRGFHISATASRSRSPQPFPSAACPHTSSRPATVCEGTPRAGPAPTAASPAAVGAAGSPAVTPSPRGRGLRRVPSLVCTSLCALATYAVRFFG